MFHMIKRSMFGVAVVGFALAGSSVALAHGDGAERQCDGEHGAKTPEERAQHAAERFQQADKNKDGFLTPDEVGAERWERIKVADANNDGKVSQAELEQAHKDGKLGHGGHKGA
jgi:Ca2+-binding EF-hand superfamily protein